MRPGITRAGAPGFTPGFTLVELLTVIGLMGLLVSLFLPVLSKVRAASNTTSCVSNLRQIGTAWAAYLAEHQGRLPEGSWTGPATRRAYLGYWPGIVDTNGVRGEALLCPAARVESDRRRGFGTVSEAWNGRLMTSGSPVRLNDRTYRVSSYGYNGHLVAGGGYGRGGGANCLSAVADAANVPAFFDCAAPDARLINQSEHVPALAPPNLRGDRLEENSPQHWRFLLGRHGRGINVYMADGSARWVRLDDALLLTWAGNWRPYRLELPAN